MTTGAIESKASLGLDRGRCVEVRLTEQLAHERGELYVDLAARPCAVTGAHNGLGANMLRMGVNYRF